MKKPTIAAARAHHSLAREVTVCDTWRAHKAMDRGSLDPSKYYNRLLDKVLAAQLKG